MQRTPTTPALRRGWTTGACATAATAAAWRAWLSQGDWPNPVEILLPRGEKVRFALAAYELCAEYASATIEKDAGDDPDVTHGALIRATVRPNHKAGVRFFAGEGVGTVTLPGLPIAVGEPAINPVPRQMMRDAVTSLAEQYHRPADVDISISVINGEALATKTWNARLGILGGLSILGTTGIVRPFSCSAWIHSIHRGIDVAVATQRPHVAGCTGATSERVVQGRYGLLDSDMLDMGDFVGGLLKYLRQHPVPRMTIGGGFGKLCKLAQGHFDLHSKRSQVDFDDLSARVAALGGEPTLVQACQTANTALEVLTHCEAQQLAIAHAIAVAAQQQAQHFVGSATRIDVAVISRDGRWLAHSDAPHDG